MELEIHGDIWRGEYNKAEVEREGAICVKFKSIAEGVICV